jgi:hypothetical protein
VGVFLEINKLFIKSGHKRPWQQIFSFAVYPAASLFRGWPLAGWSLR